MADKEHEHKEEKHGHGGGHGGGHHGGGGHEEGHEGAPEWLISFADNVTLMMGFFVILLAMTMAKVTGGSHPGAGKKEGEHAQSGPTTEMLDMAIAIREAFHNPVNINSTNPNELPLIKRVLERAKEGFALDAGIVGNKHEVGSIRPTNYRKPAGAVSFEENSANLSATGREEATRIARHFRGVRTILELRGHVSAKEAFDDVGRAMKLSFDRAVAVAGVLVDHGIDWRQIRIVACKDNDRVTPLAYDGAAQRENERVEVFPTDQVMPVYVPEQDEPAREAR
jgi:flagellar motor protein MotB